MKYIVLLLSFSFLIYGCGNDDSSGEEIEDSNQEESRDDDNLGEELEGSSQEEFRDVNFELIEQDESVVEEDYLPKSEYSKPSPRRRSLNDQDRRTRRTDKTILKREKKRARKSKDGDA